MVVVRRGLCGVGERGRGLSDFDFDFGFDFGLGEVR